MKPIRISVVEDNSLFRTALKSDIESVFSNREINVTSFATGEECLKSMEKQYPDIVILDFNLNSNDTAAINGLQVLSAIKKKNEQTSVIMLTSEDKLDIALQSFKSGASDYVVKTDTKFRKINYALMNQFKILEVKNSAKIYKYMAFGLVSCLAVLIGGVVAIQIFSPSLLH